MLEREMGMGRGLFEKEKSLGGDDCGQFGAELRLFIPTHSGYYALRSWIDVDITLYGGGEHDPVSHPGSQNDIGRSRTDNAES